MRKKSWLYLLPLVAGLLGASGAPGQAAAAESWSVTGVNSTGCASGDWNIDVFAANFDGNDYVMHTIVTSGGLVYMNEDAGSITNGSDTWGLYATDTYGPTTGTYPIPAGQPMKVVLRVERPKGTVLSSWTMEAKSCDSATLLFNGSDLDDDRLSPPADKCPTRAGKSANGCPVVTRALSVSKKSTPMRVTGRLRAPGQPAYAAKRKVRVWKVRPGPDKLVGVRTTTAKGTFSKRVRAGRYYVTTVAVLDPATGYAPPIRSRKVRVR
ncbi:hypothetical protein [Nocardioides lijunqiniae]|uniref:hypothetical protein n=1 Tax=Nocardioides lijunqiniae TaxID=2760832 RepID=UPI0018780038|nr:hypothetical protein [Nocardioides lijunqiniae]